MKFNIRSFNLSSFNLCSIAWFVLIFSIIGIILDIYLFGTKLLGFLLNIAITGLFVWLANWGCHKQGFNWIAWVVVIFIALSLAGSIYIVKNQYTDLDINRAIEEERQMRDQLGI